VDATADYYTRLGVSRQATYAQISKAYRLRASELHPDHNPRDSHHAGERMRALNEAWHTLRDPGRRAAYDRVLSPPAGGRPAPEREQYEPDWERFAPAWEGREAGWEGDDRDWEPSSVLTRDARRLRRLITATIVVLAVLLFVFTVIAFAESG
jgi:curved DNA-binding protein CbpA